MKRLSYVLGLGLCLLLLVSCGAKTSSNVEVDKLKQENFNNDVAADEPKTLSSNGYQLIELKTLVVVPDYGEFEITDAQLKQLIQPSNAGSHHSEYEVDDPNEIYLDVIMKFKNTSAVALNADEIVNAKVFYDNKYEYSTFGGIEESGGEDFGYIMLSTVEPLKETTLHYIATLPIEVKESGKPIMIQFEIYNNKYEMVVR